MHYFTCCLLLFFLLKTFSLDTIVFNPIPYGRLYTTPTLVFFVTSVSATTLKCSELYFNSLRRFWLISDAQRLLVKSLVKPAEKRQHKAKKLWKASQTYDDVSKKVLTNFPFFLLESWCDSLQSFKPIALMVQEIPRWVIFYSHP